MGEAKRRKQLNPDTYGKTPEHILNIPQRVYDYACKQTEPGIVRIAFKKDANYRYKIADVELKFTSFFKVIDTLGSMYNTGTTSNSAVDNGLDLAFKQLNECDWSNNRLICINNKSVDNIPLSDIISVIKKALKIDT